MITAGVDIGASTSKVVISKEGQILSYSIIGTGAESANSAQRAMAAALKGIDHLSLGDIEYIIATGYGRVIAPFANETVTELSCHAKGANWLFPSVRTILDMGGQDCKAIRCDEMGRLTNFAMNDKCAAGTGRFLELMAMVMDLPLEGLGKLSLEAKEEVTINSTCAVFAESEVISHIHRGVAKEEILAGLHYAIADRILELISQVGIRQEVVVTGGIAKNVAIVAELERKLGMSLLLPREPQIVGALGAALLAPESPPV